MEEQYTNSRHTSYEAAHVEFVTTQSGTTVGEILKILLSISLTPFLSAVILPWIVPPKFTSHATNDSTFYTYVRALIEYPVIVVLPLWIITVLAEQNDSDAAKWNDFVWIVIMFTCLGVMVVNFSITEPKWEGFQAFWKRIQDKPFTTLSAQEKETETEDKRKFKNEKEKSKSKPKTDLRLTMKYPFITNYRAIVTYVTVIAILAVDFSIFPRRYAKTKKYGYSLMDIGTGSFIFANGIVAPEAKSKKSNLLKSWMSSIPLFALGFVRLISVKGIEYHEVVEEYGVHWNFFFTLAAVKLLSATAFSCIDPAHSLKLSLLIGIANEFTFLTSDNLETYLLSESVPRNTILDANREGFYSILGYFAIYLSSAYIGKVIYCVKNATIKQWTLHSIRSGVHVILLWIALEVSTSFGNPCCRRIANMTYCLWILATNYTILWTLMALNLVQAVGQHIGLVHGPLIAYELKAAMEREDRKIKELNEKLKRKKSYGKTGQEVEVEKALSLLEDKLKEFEVSGKASISSEVAELIQHVESELERIAKQLKREEDEENGEESEESRNLVAMPDLTKPPVTLEAICYNGLFVFLFGNLLTGLVNLSVHTMYVPNYLALSYMWAYVTVVCLCSITLYSYKIQLKFW